MVNGGAEVVEGVLCEGGNFWILAIGDPALLRNGLRVRSCCRMMLPYDYTSGNGSLHFVKN